MGKMENVKYVTIAGFDFIIVDEVDYNGQHYFLAIDEAGEDTIAVLRQKFEDGKEMVESASEEEINAVLQEVAKGMDDTLN